MAKQLIEKHANSTKIYVDFNQKNKIAFIQKGNGGKSFKHSFAVFKQAVAAPPYLRMSF